MNDLEKIILEKLHELKENFCATGVKAEFEAEGTMLDEAFRLKNIVSEAGLEFTIKIGGCEAIKEMYEAKSVGVNSLVAPMIETPYALKKFSNAINKVFTDVENGKFFANIETITGFNNLNDIIYSEEFNTLSGIVLGRDDMTGSMGLSNQSVESHELFNIASIIASKMKSAEKEFIVGGSISTKTIDFFNKLPENSLKKFETRKIIFDSKVLKQKNVNVGLIKAIEFELLWLKNKREHYKMVFDEDTQRLSVLEKRYNNLIQESNTLYV